jgi:hypothetical protein
MSSAKTTTNHDEIRRWVEKRGGHPAMVDSTGNDRQAGGLLRIDYDEPGGNDDERLRRIDWNEFFDIFDRNGIAFLHDPDSDSRFSKFVQKESANS